MTMKNILEVTARYSEDQKQKNVSNEEFLMNMDTKRVVTLIIRKSKVEISRIYNEESGFEECNFHLT